MDFAELSYAEPGDPWLRRSLIHAVEHLSGRPRLLPTYERWKRIAAAEPDRRMTRLLELLDVRLDISGAPWPPPDLEGRPLVMIANHPFGIGDGISLLAMAEALGRPYRVFVASHLLKVPEIRDVALPIHFEGTRAATRANLETRARARAFLAGAHTLATFPAGAVATAKNPFGKAEDLPWKNFTARVVQGARASVLPVHFDGQNRPLFHAASRVSETLRLSLLVSEFIRGFPGSTVRARVGEVVPFEALQHARNGEELTAELRGRVLGLAPGGSGR